MSIAPVAVDEKVVVPAESDASNIAHAWCECYSDDGLPTWSACLADVYDGDISDWPTEWPEGEQRCVVCETFTHCERCGKAI